jgi:hypothetical protein
MSSFLRDINVQPITAYDVIAGPITGPNQILYNTYFTRSGGVYVGGAGNLNVIMADDSTNTIVTFFGVTTGQFLPIQVKYVSSTSTCTLVKLFINAEELAGVTSGLLWENAAMKWEDAAFNWD